MDLKNNEMIHNIKYKDKEIILIGTAHVSAESAELVKTVIYEEKPDSVSVELCQARYQSIVQKDSWSEMNIIQVIKKKKAFLLLTNLLLSSFQRRIAEKLNVKPGQEMITAIEAAEEIDAKIILADRDIRVTLSRTWRKMGMWGKMKLLFQLMLSFVEVDEINEEDIEQMKKQDMLQSILKEVEKSFPAIRDILIDERDKYLAYKIRSAEGDRIVAVVGAAHMPGIIKYMETDIDIESLEQIPPKKKFGTAVKWLIPVIIMVLFVLGFFYGGKDIGTDMIKLWIVVNGVLAGLGAVIALGHPLTILASILAAPLTSLNPMIAAGWVSGLVEASSRKPKVKDFESLNDDIKSVRGFWKNKVTRVLLVVVFTNLGSAIGTFIALPFLTRVFFNISQ